MKSGCRQTSHRSSVLDKSELLSPDLLRAVPGGEVGGRRTVCLMPAGCWLSYGLGNIQETTGTAAWVQEEHGRDGKPTNEHTGSEPTNAREGTALCRSSVCFMAKRTGRTGLGSVPLGCCF